jgi:hypothetical protein
VDAAHASYDGANSDDFASACLAFFLFQDMHSRTDEAPAATTLLGDYFFSRFSKHLIPIDSVPLIDAFSEYLARCTSGNGVRGTYNLTPRSQVIRPPDSRPPDSAGKESTRTVPLLSEYTDFIKSLSGVLTA